MTLTSTLDPVAQSSSEDTTSRAVVTMSGVSKVFSNGTLALSNMSLEVERGQFLSLLGPSG